MKRPEVVECRTCGRWFVPDETCLCPNGHREKPRSGSPLLALALVIGAGAWALWTSAPARSAEVRQFITTSVVWTGSNDCIEVWVPAAVGDPRLTTVCSPDHAWSYAAIAPARGEFFGADPEWQGGGLQTISCAATARGVAIARYAAAGQGDDDANDMVTCLARWPR